MRDAPIAESVIIGLGEVPAGERSRLLAIVRHGAHLSTWEGPTTAREVLDLELCTPSCLHATEPDECRCRCRGDYHGACLDAPLVYVGEVWS